MDTACRRSARPAVRARTSALHPMGGGPVSLPQAGSTVALAQPLSHLHTHPWEQGACAGSAWGPFLLDGHL